MIYLMLFLNFFQIGLFSIGGGYAAIPLIKNRIVEVNNWITMQEFTDLITIAEMTPGPIAINSATFVGTHVAGIGGAVVSTVGFILPASVIVMTLAFIYYKYKTMSIIEGIMAGLRPAVVGLIASAALAILVLTMWGEVSGINITNTNFISLGIFSLGLLLLKRFKPNPIYIILGSGLLGIFIYYVIPLL
ncbi:MAG: chromate transporter [Clostridiaceae bacterium]|nr:chromate transporter [Clostridiaceae bacterium]